MGRPTLPCGHCSPISMGFSCRLSELPESGACAPNAAFRSRSVRRPVLRDLPEKRGGDEPAARGSRGRHSPTGPRAGRLPWLPTGTSCTGTGRAVLLPTPAAASHP